jgi:hypothetical protein
MNIDNIFMSECDTETDTSQKIKILTEVLGENT